MTANRSAAALLLAALVLTTAASCGSSDNTPAQTEKKDNTLAPVETEVIDYADNLPDDLDFGGYTLRLYAGDTSTICFTADESADFINDKFYKRNLQMLDRLNLQMVTKSDTTAPWDNFTADIRKSVLSDMDEYDFLMGANWYTTGFVFDGLVQDLSEAPYINIDREYWATDYIKGMSYKGHYYFLSGPIEKTYLSNMCCTFANKNLWNSLYDGSVHEMVDSGKWTLDALKGYITEVYQDLNGDARIDEYDRVALALGSDHAVERNVSAAGIMVAPFDADGVPHLNFIDDSAPLVSFWEKWFEIKTSPRCLRVNWDAETTPNTTNAILDIFKQGHMLFAFAFLRDTESTLRDMNDDYAILPLPKLDEAQKDYVSILADQNLIAAIPRTATEEGSGAALAFLEACAAETYRSIYPAYFEDALKNKYIRDEESVKTINQLAQHSAADFGSLYIDIGFANFVRYEVSDANIASAVQKKSKIFNKQLDKMLEALEGNA
ncbi:MAG: hypothetical protein MJ175_05350 [Clostridia bacterium]|nr:hypothetical protein [Clostridia bacterium]